MVDHHFANASQGAIGLISTTAKSEEAELVRQYLRYFHWFDAQPVLPATSGGARR